MRAVTIIILGLITLISFPVISPAALIRPENLVYQGAFRLLGEGGETGWGWSGHAMAYYPAGDPNGPSDGYSGSLFGAGHDWSQNISEINIPVPVISSGKNLNELNTATTLQSFTDIRSLLFGAFEMPQVGLEYLPPQGSQTTGKLYFGWTQHLQTSPHQTTHGWCELNLSSPAPAGPWYIGQYDNYSTTDYLFSIPSAWANSHVGGRRLATGRFRDGGQGGQGPCIYACAPWQSGNPPGTNSTLPTTPLLQYSTFYYSDPQGGAYIMNRYHHSDMWSGAAWLTSGNDSSVIFVGTKGRGECWYGNPDTPVAGDYSGNGSDQPAIYRASSGLWAVRGVTQIYFGGGSDTPVPSDFTGTGRTEVGIYSSVSGLWAVQGVTRTYFGCSSDIPVTR